MRIAIIPPLGLLDTYGPAGDDYHLCLSNEVLKYPQYADFYRSRSDRGDHVILDNSAHEQLQGQSLAQLLEAADKVGPTEIVLPDRLFFGDDTLERSTIAYEAFRRSMPNVNLMGVPQGRHFSEWIDCLHGLSTLGVDTIGISKDYEVWDGGLRKLVMAAHLLGYSQKSIHLLGWGRNLWELKDLSGYVRGVDSAKPIVYALGGIELPYPLTKENAPTYPKRKSNYFNDKGPYPEAFHRLVRVNLAIFRAMARGDVRAPV